MKFVGATKASWSTTTSTPRTEFDSSPRVFANCSIMSTNTYALAPSSFGISNGLFVTETIAPVHDSTASSVTWSVWMTTEIATNKAPRIPCLAFSSAGLSSHASPV